MPEFGDLAWWLGLNVALPLAPVLLVASRHGWSA
jgi:hypothetical protein